MPAKKLAPAKALATRRQPSSTILSVPVYSLSDNSAGTLSLPKEFFGSEVNRKLLAQAVRVYITNQKTLPGSTKTRGEVVGSTKKIYRQKGTGGARHGARKAPIFVGGGITFGPKPRKVRLDLPQKMKKAALISALSLKAKNKEVLAFSGLEKSIGKTKEIAGLLQKLGVKSGLLLLGEKSENIARAVKNIPGINVLSASSVNSYEILKHNQLILTKEAIAKLVREDKK